MSESSMDETLQQAHELIEAEELEEARALLEPLLESNPNNADLWWVYAHAVDDEETGRNALSKVQELDPNYPGMATLTGQVEGEVAIDAAEFDDLLEGFDDDIDDTVPVAADFDDDFDLVDIEGSAAAEKPGSRSRIGRLAAVAIVVLFLIVVVGIFLNNDDDKPDDPTPTAVVAAATESGDQVDSTEEATEDVEATETREPTPVDSGDGSANTLTPTESATEEPTEIPPTETPEPTDKPESTEAPTDEPEVVEISAQTILDELPDIELAGEGIENIDSELGVTTLVAVCTGGGKTSREILSDVMNLIVDQVETIPTDSDAVGVRLVSCEDDRVINLIAVPVESIVAFKAGNLGESEFLGQWRAIQQS